MRAALVQAGKLDDGLGDRADRGRVLRRMDGPLDDTVPAARAITIRERHGGRNVHPGGCTTPAPKFCRAVYDSGTFGWDGGLGTSWPVGPSQDLTVIVR